MADVYAGLGDYLAKSADIDLGPALDEVAHKIAAAATSLAAQHVESGDYISSIHVTTLHDSESGRDRFVYSDDPAALSIEYGHVAHTSEGKGRRVEGQHIMGRAADSTVAT